MAEAPAAPAGAATTTAKFLGTEIEITGLAGEHIFERVRRTRALYEHDLLETLAAIPLDPEALVVDVGANLGNHTLAFAAAMPNDVLAIEPEAVNVQLLEHNLAQNSATERVSVHRVAAWSERRRLRLFNDDPTNRGKFAVQHDDRGEIDGVPLDDLVGSRPVALLKIDVEGAEVEVLQGAQHLLARSHPLVVAEAHTPLALRELVRLLSPLGYTPVHVGGVSDNYVWAWDHAPAPLSAQGVQDLLQLARDRRSTRESRTQLDRLMRAVSRNDEHSSTALAVLDEHVQALGASGDQAGEEGRTPLSAENALRRRVEALTSAYGVLSRRLERALPGAWSADAAEATLKRFLDLTGGRSAVSGGPLVAPPGSAVAELRPRSVDRRERVRVGIATMPGREAGLARVLASLAPQVDEIFVYLNEMTSVPDEVTVDPRVRFFVGPNYGDRGKFLFVEGFEGYYLTCDDDIDYPDFYVDHVIDGIERYGRRAIVGWHGSQFSPQFEDYYDADSRRVLSYSTLRGNDTPVHLLGTGAMGMHTSTLEVRFSDFEAPNTADVWLARKAHEHQVPMMVLAHGKGWADAIDRDATSISTVSIKASGPVSLDTRAIATEVIKSAGPWQTVDAGTPFQRPRLSVAIVGRTDRTRWKKGGIVKSCHGLAHALRRFGAAVELVDIETGDPFGLGGVQPDLVLVYVGDPQRPDFVRVEEVVARHAGAGRAVLVNLSVQGTETRSRFIAERMRRWQAEFPGLVHLMTFTTVASSMPHLDELAGQLVPVPKTLGFGPERAAFHESEGIFLGDAAKLADPELIGGDVHEWIGEIRAALPGVRLYAVQQYRSRFDVELGLDEIWPFTPDELSARLARVRVMVAPVMFATYEMVPMEAAALGVPIVYRPMPQSLSETLGLAGVQVRSPADLRGVLPALYGDPSVWRSFSRAGRLRAASQDPQASAGQIYLQLLGVVNRSRAAVSAHHHPTGVPLPTQQDLVEKA